MILIKRMGRNEGGGRRRLKGKGKRWRKQRGEGRNGIKGKGEGVQNTRGRKEQWGSRELEEEREEEVKGNERVGYE